MRLWHILLLRPKLGLGGLIIAAWTAYGAYDHIVRHWQALLIAAAVFVLTTLVMRVIPDPKTNYSPGAYAFSTGFGLTFVAYIFTTSAYSVWSTTGHWAAIPGLAIATAGGIIATTFWRPRQRDAEI